MQEKRNFRWRTALYLLLLLILYLLQFSRGTRLRVLGASPDLLPFFLASLALFEGPYLSAAFGLLAGLLCAVNAGSPEGLLALYYSLCCLGAGYLTSRYLRRTLPAALLCGTFIFSLKILLTFFFFYALVYRAHSLGALVRAGHSLLLSLVLAPLLYWLVRSIHRRFTAEEE